MGVLSFKLEMRCEKATQSSAGSGNSREGTPKLSRNERCSGNGVKCDEGTDDHPTDITPKLKIQYLVMQRSDMVIRHASLVLT